MWFLLFEKSGSCAAEISLKPLLTLVWGGWGRPFSSSSFQRLTVAADVSVVPLVTGQDSCEVNDSTNKKLLVIRLDVQALLLFKKKSIS